MGTNLITGIELWEQRIGVDFGCNFLILVSTRSFLLVAEDEQICVISTNHITIEN